MAKEELMPTAWHTKRWSNVCRTEDEKKNERNGTNFY